MKYYICKHFKLYNFISRNLYFQKGSICWQLLDPRILYTCDKIYNYFSFEFEINNWFENTCHLKNITDIEKILDLKTTHQYNGFWPTWYKSNSALDQHRFGRAVTIVGNPEDLKEIKKEILKNQKEFKYVTNLKSTATSLIIDVRQTGSGNIIYSN